MNIKQSYIKCILFCYLLIVVVAGLWPFNFFQRNNVNSENSNGLYFFSPSIAYTQEPLLFDELNTFTIFLRLSSDYSGTNGYVKILTNSLDEKRINFMIGQWNDSLVFKIKSDKSTRPVHFETDNVFRKGSVSSIAMVYDGEKLILFRDGQKINEKKIETLHLSKWNRSFPLVLGSEANGRLNWKGTLYSIAVFDKPLSAQSLKDLPTTINELHPLIFYNFEDSKATLIQNQGTLQSVDLLVPKYFVPYKRTILGLPWLEQQGYRHNFNDSIFNIFGFIPLGFFFMLWFHQNEIPLKKALFFSLLTGFCISLTVELFQSYLPTRSSDMNDLIMNTFGTMMGSFCFICMRRPLKESAVRA